MEDNAFSPANAVNFGFKSTLDHIRLFFLTLLAGTVLIAGVVALVGLLNISFVKQIPPSLVDQIRQCGGFTDCISLFTSASFREDFLGLLSTNVIWVIISVLVLGIIFAGFDFGLKKLALDVHDNKQSSVKTAFSYFHLSPQGLIAWCMYLFMVWIGWLFFIIPGFIALLRFSFFPYFIVDKNVGPIDSLKMSYEVTKGHMWNLFGLWVVVKIIVALGALSWLGVLLTWPLSVLAYAQVYRNLQA